MRKVLRQCAVCGGPYMARPADLARGWATSCSKTCAAKLRERHQPPSKAQRAQRRRYAQAASPAVQLQPYGEPHHWFEGDE
jgi:hypothetical protein